MQLMANIDITRLVGAQGGTFIAAAATAITTMASTTVTNMYIFVFIVHVFQ